MELKEFLNQDKIIDLSFFNFSNAVTAAYFANKNLEVIKVNNNFKNFFPILKNVTNILFPSILDQLGVPSDQIKNFEKELKPEDPFMQVVKAHPIVEKLLENGFTGNKGKGGFYENKTIDGNEFTKALNYESFTYYDFEKVDLELAHRVEKEGIKAFLEALGLELDTENSKVSITTPSW